MYYLLKIGLRYVFLVTAVFLESSQLKADPITVDAGWYSFNASGSGVTGAGVDPPWTFNSVSPTLLTVVDRYVYGDRFEVYDFGSLLGATSESGAAGSCEGSIDACFADPNSSKGFFNLAVGDHSITFVQIAGSSTSGSFRVDTVPEPATIVLLSFSGMALFVRRRPGVQ